MRYLFFVMWYRQWFKNIDGIKGFAHQVMNWLMRSTLRLAANLQKQNKQLTEKVKELTLQLTTKLLHPTIDADEYAALKGKIRTYSIILWICITGEAFFNYFAAKALFNFAGWLAIAAQTIFAVLITWVAVALFENLFNNLLNEIPYKGKNKQPRNWGKVIMIIIMAIGYEAFIYYLCKVRGIQIEGGDGTGIIANAMMIAGMLIPIIAGYYAYEKRRFISPYKNTLLIEKLRKNIAAKENRINANQQQMENHFNQKCQEYWAYLQEFKTYKENWNYTHSISPEILTGHFAETQQSFITEAIARYKKEAIHTEVFKIEQLTPLAQNNEQEEEIKKLFAN